MSLDRLPRTWTDGELVSALLLNPELRDAISGIQVPWDTYTAILTSGGATAPVLGSTGSIVGRFRQVGKTVDVKGAFLFNGSGVVAGTGTYQVSLPAGLPVSNNLPAVENLGTIHYFNGTNWIPAAAFPTAGRTTFLIQTSQSSTGNGLSNLMGTSTPGGASAIGAGHQATWKLRYETV